MKQTAKLGEYICSELIKNDIIKNKENFRSWVLAINMENHPPKDKEYMIKTIHKLFNMSCSNDELEEIINSFSFKTRTICACNRDFHSFSYGSGSFVDWANKGGNKNMFILEYEDIKLLDDLNEGVINLECFIFKFKSISKLFMKEGKPYYERSKSREVLL